MSISIEWEKGSREQFERDMEAAAKEAEAGFPDAMQAVGEIFAQGIDDEFMTSGHGKWAPLSQRTVNERRFWEIQTGRKAVAGLYTPLRRSDDLRLGATAIRPGARGSAFKRTGKTVQVGPDENVIDYAGDRNFGNPGKNEPARPYIVLTEQVEQKATDAAQKHVDAFGEKYGVK